MNNQKGMTLVELLVYIVLAGFLLAPVIMLMQNSSVNMARDASNVTLRMTGRELVSILFDDLRNTGYKVDPDDFTADTAGSSYVDMATFHADVAGKCAPTATPAPPAGCRDSVFYGGTPATRFPTKFDISSFRPGQGGASGRLYDTLTVRMGKLSPAGTWDGIDTVTYYVQADSALVRKASGITGTSTKSLARNIAALRFQFSDDLDVWYEFDNYNHSAPSATHINNKSVTRYIKAILVHKDSKKLAASKSQTITVVPGATITDNTTQHLYERHEIVIPIPNNGLFP
jgi:Tfp pilus assembly protein PilW